MTRGRFAGHSQGSILILVIFVLAFMSLFSLSVGYAVRQKMQVISRLDTRQKLRKIGEAAIRKSVYELLQHKKDRPPFDALPQSWSRNETEFRDVKIDGGEFSVLYPAEPSTVRSSREEPVFRYGLIDEERKININRVKSPDILQRLFLQTVVRGNDQARALAEAIMDWRDEDDDASISGAESYYYKGLNPAYLPRNAAFPTLQELRYVKGMTDEIYEKLSPYLTVQSSGLINLNTASRPVLAAAGLEPVLCDKILVFRAGRDRNEGTADDLFFEDLSSVPQTLANSGYLDDNEKKDLTAAIQSGIFTLSSKYFSAVAIARLAHKKQTLRVTAIFDDQGVIQHWEEEFQTSP
jgi:type II secretory pathway component PulK